jgi:ParB-like chromosome segregation protein Spo0J
MPERADLYGPIRLTGDRDGTDLNAHAEKPRNGGAPAERETPNWTDPATWHPAARLFPLMSEPDLIALAVDITIHGLRTPITVAGRQLLDGRNRAIACERIGIDPNTVAWSGTDAVTWVVSQNLHRRHLTESQRAMTAARLATMRQGARTDLASIEARSQEQAADLLHVGRASVQRARVVLDRAVPELIAAVDAGRLAVSLAARLVHDSPEVQRAVAVWVLAKKGRDPDRAVAIAREQAVAAARRRLASHPTGAHRIVYADPPWSVEPAETAAAPDCPAWSLSALRSANVAAFAAADAVLFCWAPFSLLPHALETVKAWGFTYRTAFVWQTPRSASSHYHTADLELLLVATRGSCRPDVAPGGVQLIRAADTKAQAARAVIDSLYRQGLAIELAFMTPGVAAITDSGPVALDAGAAFPESMSHVT